MVTLFAAAQELKVESFTETTMDIMDASMQKRDYNNDICAIVKVLLPLEGVEFEGVFDYSFHTSEYWVYMSPGKKYLRVICPMRKPLMVYIPDYIGEGVSAKTIYELDVSGYPVVETIPAPKEGTPMINVTQDYAKDVESYRKAAKQGDAMAQYNLGVCYHEGQGVEKDYSKAVEWYRKAAEQGNARAQYNLGYCYEKGLGVEQNYTKAVEWLRKAAEQGLALAQYNLGVCYHEGQGVELDYTKAVEWFRKAAAQDLALAQYNLGVCYYNGQGVEQNYTKAVEWLRKAAAQGNETAKEILGNLGEPY